MAPVIHADAVSLSYGSRSILTDVNVNVREGEFWFFLGPNGHGKTTMVRSILGLLRPSSGTLRVAPAPGQTGFVPQRCDLNSALPTTVREFVLLGLVGTSQRKGDAAASLAWALDRVDLGALADRSYWALSGGQRQRALLARALVRRPTLLILDEPTNGLDLPTEDALLQALARLHREEGITVIFVTHDLPIAARYATHAALFHDGRVTSGSRDEVFISDALARTYGVALSVQRDAKGELSVGIHRTEGGA